ncbi:MAG: GHKL domain-containing protein, partial [Proteobacteria bacterium]
SAHGLDPFITETPRDISFCGHAIHEHDVFVVNDASKDDRFSDNPLVTGDLNVRFYAGAQLFAPNGMAIGALCVIDSHPRELTEQQKAGLNVLAKQVMAQMELKAAHRQLSEHFTALQKSTALVMDYQRQLAEGSRLVALEEMSSGIAHEINNPLAIVLGRAELLLEKIERAGTLDPATAVNDLKTIVKTSRRMATIVTGLRTFARDASQEPFQQSRVQDVIEDTIALCGARFRERDIELKLEIENTDLHCRPVQISQILVNLLNNAYDAISNNEGDRWIAVKTTASDSGVLISVTDSGHGIPKQVAEKMMQPFFTTKETGKGMGLGLSISCGLAESHHGSLKIDGSSTNTKFDLFIPHYRGPDHAKVA